MRRLLTVLLLAALTACTQQYVRWGEVGGATQILMRFQPPYTCSMVIGGQTYLPNTNEAATIAALKHELAIHPHAQLVADRDIPYKCLGGAIVELQRAGFKKIGFISEPPGSQPRSDGLHCSNIMAQASALMRAFDKNGDGQLNRVEWAPYQSLLRQHALKFQMEHNLQPPDPEEINGSFAEYDRDKDGEITLKEITGNVCPLPTAH